MQAVAQHVLAAVPGATLSQDSGGRETDIAIDHSEFVHLAPEQIAHAVQLKPVRKEVVDFKLSPFGRHDFYGVDMKK